MFLLMPIGGATGAVLAFQIDSTLAYLGGPAGMLLRLLIGAKAVQGNEESGPERYSLSLFPLKLNGPAAAITAPARATNSAATIQTVNGVDPYIYVIAAPAPPLKGLTVTATDSKMGAAASGQFSFDLILTDPPKGSCWKDNF